MKVQNMNYDPRTCKWWFIVAGVYHAARLENDRVLIEYAENRAPVSVWRDGTVSTGGESIVEEALPSFEYLASLIFLRESGRDHVEMVNPLTVKCDGHLYSVIYAEVQHCLSITPVNVAFESAFFFLDTGEIKFSHIKMTGREEKKYALIAQTYIESLPEERRRALERRSLQNVAGAEFLITRRPSPGSYLVQYDGDRYTVDVVIDLLSRRQTVRVAISHGEEHEATVMAREELLALRAPVTDVQRIALAVLEREGAPGVDRGFMSFGDFCRMRVELNGWSPIDGGMALSKFSYTIAPDREPVIERRGKGSSVRYVFTVDGVECRAGTLLEAESAVFDAIQRGADVAGTARHWAGPFVIDPNDEDDDDTDPDDTGTQWGPYPEFPGTAPR